KPVLVDTVPDDGYQLHYEALARAVTPRTRAIMRNSPCNPTGAVLGKEAMEVVARVLRANPEVVAITDDIYRKLVYGVEWISLPRLAPDVAERVILVDGVSKTYAMTGWRIGFTAGPKELVKAMDTLQGQSTTNPAAVAQAAAVGGGGGAIRPGRRPRLHGGADAAPPRPPPPRRRRAASRAHDRALRPRGRHPLRAHERGRRRGGADDLAARAPGRHRQRRRL